MIEKQDRRSFLKTAAATNNAGTNKTLFVNWLNVINLLFVTYTTFSLFNQYVVNRPVKNLFLKLYVVDIKD